MRAERREETATALRERLRADEAAIEIPDGLWERVREPRGDVTPARERGTRWNLRRRPLSTAVTAVAAAAVASVVFGTWWTVSPSTVPGAAQGSPADASGKPTSITLRVHNVERACRELHTLECALRVAKSPYELYADPGNAAGRVWHGDELTATCVVTDGQMVTDEKGVSSTRWYRVEKSGRGGERIEGWLPGVRTRNTKEVELCSEAERPRSYGS